MNIIDTLTKEDVRHFKLFLKRSNIKVADAPVSKLFDVIRKGNYEDDKTIHQEKFNQLKANAFYRLKNRMLVDINKSLLVLNYNKVDKILILNYLILSEIFLYKSAFKIAYNFLCKAEKKAAEHEFYSILETIYEQMIALSHQYVDLPLLTIIKKKKDVVKRKEEINAVNDMLAEVMWRLQKSNYSAKGLHIVDELDNIKNKLDNINLIDQSPSLRIQMQKSIRMMLLQKGDFSSLQLYLSKTLKEFDRDAVFNKNNHNQKIVMQTWLINVNLKLFNFHLVYEYAEELKESLHQYKNLYYETHVWTYYQCVFAGCFYSNQLQRCLQISKKYSSEEVLKDHSSLINLNLAIVYFCLKDIKKANECLNKVLKPIFFDALTNELKLMVIIVELLFYYESKDFSYFNYSIKKIQKKYAHVLSLPQFKRQHTFLKVLVILGRDISFSEEKTEEIVSRFIDDSPPFEAGTNEGIHYKSWLVAQLENKNYYTVLLTILKK